MSILLPPTSVHHPFSLHVIFSSLQAPCFRTHSRSFPILKRAQKGCEEHHIVPRGSSHAQSLPEKAAGCQQQPLAIPRLVDGFGPALCSLSTSPRSFTCLSPTRMAALERGPGDAPDGHLLYFWHTTHVLNEWEAECCTKQKPVRGCRLSQANSYATEGKKKKKRSLEETLKPIFQKPRNLGTVPHLT